MEAEILTPLIEIRAQHGNNLFSRWTSMIATLRRQSERGDKVKLIVPDGMTEIKADTFHGFNALVEVEFPASLEVIGDDSFRDCKFLTRIHFPVDSALTSIGYDSFRGCTALTEVHFPASLEMIESSAFSRCEALTQIHFPVNSALTSIEWSAFSRCYELTEVHFPASLEDIGDSSFQICAKLTRIHFPANSKLSRIDDHAFHRCGLTEVHFPASLERIGREAFTICEDLTQIHFPDNSALFEMDEGALMRCDQLTHIRCPSTKLGVIVTGRSHAGRASGPILPGHQITALCPATVTALNGDQYEFTDPDRLFQVPLDGRGAWRRIYEDNRALDDFDPEAQFLEHFRDVVRINATDEFTIYYKEDRLRDLRAEIILEGEVDFHNLILLYTGVGEEDTSESEEEE